MRPGPGTWGTRIDLGWLRAGSGGAQPGPMSQSRHPSITSLLAQFRYEHLPPDLREVSRLFADLAYRMVEPAHDGGLGLDGAELTVALRKLLEAKDCAVRARLEMRDPESAAATVEAEFSVRAHNRHPTAYGAACAAVDAAQVRINQPIE